MKLSLIKVAALASLLVGCGTKDEAPEAPPPAAPTAAPTDAAPRAPARSLIDGTALPTSALNLIADPGFGLVGQQASFGAFLAATERSFDLVDLATTFDSRSPAAFAGACAVVKPPGATNTKSDAVMVFTSFPGGEGPFDAQVWVSRSDVAGNPVGVSIDDNGIRASVNDASLEGEAFDLQVVEGAAKQAGHRTWTLLRGQIPRALTYGGFFIVRTGVGGGSFLIAAPQVLAQPLASAPTTRSSQAGARARAMTAAERRAIARYAAIPPRLTPATSRATSSERF